MSSWRGERGGSPDSATCQDQRLPGVRAIRNPQKSLDETDHLAAGLTLIGLGCRGAASRGTFNHRKTPGREELFTTSMQMATLSCLGLQDFLAALNGAASTGTSNLAKLLRRHILPSQRAKLQWKPRQCISTSLWQLTRAQRPNWR
jgi:hypothetical protein